MLVIYVILELSFWKSSWRSIEPLHKYLDSGFMPVKRKAEDLAKVYSSKRCSAYGVNLRLSKANNQICFSPTNFQEE